MDRAGLHCRHDGKADAEVARLAACNSPDYVLSIASSPPTLQPTLLQILLAQHQQTQLHLMFSSSTRLDFPKCHIPELFPRSALANILA